MESLALAAVLLFALLVGLAVPVLLQLRSTLKRAEEFIETTSAKTDGALAELTLLGARLNRVAGEVESNLPRMQRALDATDGVVTAIEKIREPLRVVAAMGPAAFAAGKSLFASFMASRAQAPSEHEPESTT